MKELSLNILDITENSVKAGAALTSILVDEEGNTLKLTIEDNGSGISGKDLPHIFERFYKADNSSPQSVGIGLALAKNIISAHSGIIEVESEKGKGTKFTVKIYAM